MRRGESFSNVYKMIDAIREECELLTLKLMREAKNDKEPSASLQGSNIYNDLQVEVDESNDGFIINLLVNDYIDYIQGGRAPGKKFPWSIAWNKGAGVLVQWASRKGIGTDNSTIYFIWKSIIENGIKPRPIINRPDGLWTNPTTDKVLFELVDEYWDKWASDIFEAALKQITEWFNI